MDGTPDDPASVSDVHDPFSAKFVTPAAKVEACEEGEDMSDYRKIDVELSNFVLNNRIVFFMMNQVITDVVSKVKIVVARLQDYQLTVTYMVKTTEQGLQDKNRL